MPEQIEIPEPDELNDLMAKASAVAFLLLNEGAIRLTSGELSPAGFTAMAAAMVRYWPAAFSKAVNRTVGLSLDQKYVFLFAKHLPECNGLLGLVFPIQTPLIRIRQDMTHFMRLFIERPQSDRRLDKGLEQSLQSIDIIGPVPDPELHQLPDKWKNKTKDVSEDLHVIENNLSTSQRNKSVSHPPEPWLDATNAPADILPKKIRPVSDWQPLNEEKSQNEDLVSILQGKYQIQETVQPIRVDRVPSSGSTQNIQAKPVILEDTHPCRIELARVQEDIQAVSNVTFYLVPAATRHFLIGELSTWLKRWLPALCETYGWELGFLSIRPDYLKWTLVDFPEALTQQMLQIVRQQTSGRIFRVFPNLKVDNDSGDFWTPGYLMDSQGREFTTQALMVHLAANRLAVQPPTN